MARFAPGRFAPGRFATQRFASDKFAPSSGGWIFDTDEDGFGVLSSPAGFAPPEIGQDEDGFMVAD